MPAEVRGKIDGCLRGAGADDDPEARLVDLAEIACREHPGIRNNHHVLQAVALLELTVDRQDRRGLRREPLEAADLQREPVPVNEQPHDDLRIDPAFLGEADLAEVVFLLGLEIQCRDVIQTQRDVPGPLGVDEADLRDLLPPATAVAAPHGPFTGRPLAQIVQDPIGVQDRGRLHDPATAVHIVRDLHSRRS